MAERPLDPIWHECFELAWEAFRAGTIPVGAVVADSSGAIVARGRNRIFEDSAPAGQLAGSYIAHAELNALAGLPAVPSRDGHGAVRRPCPVHDARAVRALRRRRADGDDRRGSLRLARSLWGKRGLPPGDPHTARLPLALQGPLDGLLGDLGELLHVAHFLWRKPESHVVAAHRERNTGLVELAERIDLTAAARAGASFDDAMQLVASARAQR